MLKKKKIKKNNSYEAGMVNMLTYLSTLVIINPFMTKSLVIQDVHFE